MILIIFFACTGYLCLQTLLPGTQKYIAEIYQDGELLMSIPLWEVNEAYEFTVTQEGGGFNVLRVVPGENALFHGKAPGEIGVISANCPNLLCVHQGMIHSDLLPVSCLPNRLVIRLKKVTDGSANLESGELDAVTY